MRVTPFHLHHRSPPASQSYCLIREARPRRHGPATAVLGDNPQRAERANHRIVGAITGELHVQMHLSRPSSDDSAKIPLAVVPVRSRTGEEVAKIGARLVPYPHVAAGQ